MDLTRWTDRVAFQISVEISNHEQMRRWLAGCSRRRSRWRHRRGLENVIASTHCQALA